MTTALVKKIASAIGGELLPDNRSHHYRMEISSETSNKLYIVAQSNASNEWGCSCPGWAFNRGKTKDGLCKHLRSVKPLLVQIGGVVGREEFIAGGAVEEIEEAPKKLDPFTVAKNKKTAKKKEDVKKAETRAREALRVLKMVDQPTSKPARSRTATATLASSSQVQDAVETLENINVEDLELPFELQKKYLKRLAKIQAQIEMLADDLKKEA